MLKYQSNQAILENPKIDIDLNKIALYFDSRGLSFWKPFIMQKIVLLGTLSSDHKCFQAFPGYLKINSEIDLIEHLIRLIGFDGLIADDYVAPISNSEKIIGSKIDSETAGSVKTSHSDTQKHESDYNNGYKPKSENGELNQSINSKKYKNIINIRNFLSKVGFLETVTRPFIEQEGLVLGSDKAIKLINPNSSLKPYFRDNLIFSQLEVIASGLQKGYKNQPIFEIAKVYYLSPQTNLQSQSVNTEVLESDFELKGNYQAGLMAFDLDAYFWTSLIQQYLQNLDLSFDDLVTVKHENRFGSGYVYTFLKDGLMSGLLDYTDAEKKSEQEAKQGVISFELIEINNKTKKKMGLPIQKKLWSLTINLNNSLEMEFRDAPKYRDAGVYPKIKRSYNLETTLEWKQLRQTIQKIQIPDVHVQLTPLEKNEQKTLFEATFSADRNLSKEEITTWENSLFETFPQA